jgi:type II secretory pathway pseudopilin PulG
MIVLPDMMSWPHFVQMPGMRNLPIHEQTRLYYQYSAEQQAMYAQIMAQINAVGSGGTPPVQETPPLSSNCIEFTVETTTSTYFTFTFNTTGPINFTVDWGDGTTHEDSGFGGVYTEEHTYTESNQEYVVRVCFDDPNSVIEFDFTGDD